MHPLEHSAGIPEQTHSHGTMKAPRRVYQLSSGATAWGHSSREWVPQLTCSSVLTWLCSSAFQSQVPRKQERFAHASLHTRGMCYSRLEGPKPLHVICKHFPLFLVAVSRELMVFNSMDFRTDAWGTLLLLKCSIYPYDFFLLGTESGNALPYDNTWLL